MRVSEINITVADDGSMGAFVGFAFDHAGNGVSIKVAAHPHDSVAMILSRAAAGIGAALARDVESAIERAALAREPSASPDHAAAPDAPRAGLRDRMRGFFRRPA